MPTIIWRELLCREAGAAREFYATVFGWDFVTERATDFAWGSGPGAYHLVKADTGIHAGIAEIEAPGLFGWISYAWVRDVPRALGALAKAGAAVLRPTFDVPGVGRNAILQTPGGAGFGIATPAYEGAAAAPRFATDVILTSDTIASHQFLAEMDRLCPASDPDSPMVAEAPVTRDLWFPCFSVQDPGRVSDTASALGARLLSRQQTTGCMVLTDPMGHAFGVSGPEQIAV